MPQFNWNRAKGGNVLCAVLRVWFERRDIDLRVGCPRASRQAYEDGDKFWQKTPSIRSLDGYYHHAVWWF